MKKINYLLLSIVILLITLLSTKTVYGCWFHTLIPPTASDEYIDSYYYNYLLDEPLEYDGAVQTEGIIYIMYTKRYVAIIDQDDMVIGVYLIDSEKIESIEQSNENDREVIITFNDSSTIAINSFNQFENEDNIFCKDDETGFVETKEAYQYLWDQESYTSNNTQEMVDTTINNDPDILLAEEMYKKNQFWTNFFTVIKIVFLLIISLICAVIFFRK